MACPSNAIIYNSSLCACPPGQLYNRRNNSCFLFRENSEIDMDSGVDYYSVSFPETIFSFDSIKKFSQSQAVFLEATLVMVLSWLLCCLFLRFMKLGDGRSIWFKLRWWLSRFDLCYSTRHWLDDQKVVTKRKTELGGAFSIASWILFIGLFAALLYQIIAKRTIEVHNVRATNAPDLASFANDLEFNITTVSSMSCSNLRGLGNLVAGSPGFSDFRVDALSNFANYACHNTSMGPTLSFKCSNCYRLHDYMYISWQFVDTPNNPAMAVGFRFNFTVKSPASKKHLSFVSGTLKNGSTFDDRPVTFRGNDANILKFNLFPRLYHNLHNLRLLQPLFHEFLPGSLFYETNSLQASLQNSNDGLINTTLFINYLSAYVVEIENRSIIGPVSFLADLGGLYCFSIGIFFYLLVQCEFRIKRLRNEDSILRNIRNRQKAQQRWDKLRKYVMYTWGCKTLHDDYDDVKDGSTCSNLRIPSLHHNGSLHKIGSSKKRRQKNNLDPISFNKKVKLPSEKKATQERSHTLDVESGIAGTASNPEERPSYARGETTLSPEKLGSTNNGKRHSRHPDVRNASKPQAFPLGDDYVIPPPPSLVLKDGSEVEMSDIQKNFQRLYDYNMTLRDKLVATQSYLHALATKSTSPVPKRSDVEL
ncbi:Transmembrane protein [Melia azedarach]|nr:Transmembrane protein [Melia azedarach]